MGLGSRVEQETYVVGSGHDVEDSAVMDFDVRLTLGRR